MTSPKKQSSKRTIDQVEEKQNEETKNEAKKEEDKPTAGEPDKDASNHKMNEKEEPVSKKAKTNAKSGESKENSANSAKSGSKRATRSSAKSGTTQHQPKAIIQFLLSDEAITMLDQLETNDADDLQFPRDRLNPFQDLLAACMVSKPISHRVTTRAINGLFSKTNSLTSPQEVLDFGRDKVLESLHRSKTLHKDKTAGQIIGIAEVCQSEFNGDWSLNALREQASHDPAEERDLIVKSFKGYGPKTVEIFFRRVQVDWEEVYPFADDSTIKAAKEVGLQVEDAEGLKELVDAAIDEKDDKARRSAFGRVVDVLVYLGLEHKTEEVGSKIAADANGKE